MPSLTLLGSKFPMQGCHLLLGSWNLLSTRILLNRLFKYKISSKEQNIEAFKILWQWFNSTTQITSCWEPRHHRVRSSDRSALSRPRWPATVSTSCACAGLWSETPEKTDHRHRSICIRYQSLRHQTFLWSTRYRARKSLLAAILCKKNVQYDEVPDNNFL